MPEQSASAGASIRALRKLAGMTLAETADAAGTAVAYLSKVETGKLTPTKAYVAQVTVAIATRLGTAA